jgi:FtsP/CotA-like multicopper oxidase with cupredoxin domain
MRSIRKLSSLVVTGALLSTSVVVLGAVLDDAAPPTAGDPSAYTWPYTADLSLLPAANAGAFGGGPTGTLDDAHQNVVLVAPGTGLDIPTGAAPSPLFGAQPFTQQMLLFEEFGRENLANAPAAPLPFPQPALGPAPENDPIDVSASGPNGADLEDFLGQSGISPAPTQFSNTIDQNPWKSKIEGFLGRNLVNPPAEGRPPGKGWSHQRWNEYYPRVFFKTAQAGARENLGMRDAKQRHGYNAGEFGPGGLYHTVYSSNVPGTTLTGSTTGVRVRFHPNFPEQNHTSVWTFDGTMPPKLAVARYGEPILMRHYNALPINPAANRGFGIHTISTHEHNGHNPAESDGYTNAFFFPGQYYDYRWPMALAGSDTVNTTASDPRAASPCSPGESLMVNDGPTATERTCDANGRIQVRGDWRETMSTHWFHDHMLDFTAQNVYKGNAVMFNYYSALDRGNEAHDDGVNLRLPSGSALAWGNRDYDMNLVIADKAWDATGQLWFNIFNKDGFVGDQVLVNWQYKPFVDVRARRYRFRILNGSVSRYFALALVKQVNGGAGEMPGPSGSGVSYNRVPFYMVANDGNIMEHTVPFDGTVDLDGSGNPLTYKGTLPVQGIAERYDIIVDFAAGGIAPGDKLYFVNTAEHQTGKGINAKIPVADILSEKYKPVASATGWTGGDPGCSKILELRVVSYAGTDQSMNPADYTAGKKTMIPLAIDRNDPRLQTAAIHRTFDFGRSNGTDESPWTIKTNGGAGLNMDPRRISAAPRLGTGPTQGGFVGTNAAGYDNVGALEIWQLNGAGGWSHPIHIHFEEGIVLARGGAPPPAWETWARKDVYRIGPESDSKTDVTLAIRFREFAGTFMEHCHNTQHEDHAMLLRWDIEHPGQTQLMPAPMPTWDGVTYVDSAALPTFRIGDGVGLVGGSGNGGDVPVPPPAPTPTTTGTVPPPPVPTGTVPTPVPTTTSTVPAPTPPPAATGTSAISSGREKKIAVPAIGVNGRHSQNLPPIQPFLVQ